MVHPRLDSAEDEPVVSGEKPVIVKVLDDVPLSATKASFLDKLRDVPPLLKYIVPLTLVYFFEYFINQGLVSGAWSVLGRARAWLILGATRDVLCNGVCNFLFFCRAVRADPLRERWRRPRLPVHGLPNGVPGRRVHFALLWELHPHREDLGPGRPAGA